MRIILLGLVFLHGLIHFMGFAKAFHWATVSALTQPISKTEGIGWLIAGSLFILSFLMILLKKDAWWVWALPAILLSQWMIYFNWQDAKYGSIVNLLVLVAVVLQFWTWNYKKKYDRDVRNSLEQTIGIPDAELAESDIQHLPEPVKKYLRFSGVLGKPKVKNFKVVFKGKIRQKGGAWMPFTSEQYNFLEPASRFFYMRATMKNLPVAGYHRYMDADAYMDIRLFSLFRVQYLDGPIMDRGETVTFLNDLACMSPASLCDPRIRWVESDSTKAKAVLTIKDQTISAWLHFNERGELIDFISDDRPAAAAKGDALLDLPWSTPLRDYKEWDGIKHPGYAETIYQYPDGKFCYGTFELERIEYNVKK